MDLHFAPWDPTRGHAGLSKEEVAERCALTTNEELAKLTTSPEFLAREKERHLIAANPARSWLSWLKRQSRRAAIVALLITTYFVSQAALLGMKQPAAFWPHHTGTKAPSPLPTDHHLAACDESAAGTVSGSQSGDLGEEDTPCADYGSQELIQELADTEQDSPPSIAESQIQAKGGQGSKVLSQILATDRPKLLPEDDVSQESFDDSVSGTTDNYTSSTESLVAAQLPSPSSAIKVMWGLVALLALCTALSMAARWQWMRLRRVRHNQQAVSHKEDLAPLCIPAPPTSRSPLFAAQDKHLDLACADNSSDKENEPEHSQHRDTTILAVKGAPNSNHAETEDLRRQLDVVSHAASYWECNYWATTGPLQEKCEDLESKIVRAAQEIKTLQEKLQDEESRLRQAALPGQLEDSSATIEAQQLRQTVKDLESDVEVLAAERDAFRDQNTALEALLESAQEAAAATSQPSASMLHGLETPTAVGVETLSNLLDKSEARSMKLEATLRNLKDRVCQLIFDLNNARIALGGHQHSPRCPLAGRLDTALVTLKQLIHFELKDNNSRSDWMFTPAFMSTSSPARSAASAPNTRPTSAHVPRLPLHNLRNASPGPATPVSTGSVLNLNFPAQGGDIDRLRHRIDETIQVVEGACLRFNSASSVEPMVLTQMAGTTAASGDSAALREMEQMHLDLALVTFRVRNLMELLDGSGATVTDVNFLNSLEETDALVSMMTAFAEAADSAFLDEQRGQDSQDAAARRHGALTEFRATSKDLLYRVKQAAAFVIALADVSDEESDRATTGQHAHAWPGAEQSGEASHLAHEAFSGASEVSPLALDALFEPAYSSNSSLREDGGMLYNARHQLRIASNRVAALTADSVRREQEAEGDNKAVPL